MSQNTLETQLKVIIEQSVKFQVLVFRFIAGFMFFGAVFIALLVAFAPTEPGEENIRLGIGIFAIICLLNGFYMLYLGKQLRTKMVDLIFNQPENITEAYHYRVQKNGVVVHGVHLKTTKGKKVGLNVPSELLAQHAPHITIK